jgi:hypothetical protein
MASEMLLQKNIEFSNLNCVFILHFNNIALSSTAGYIFIGKYEHTSYINGNVFAIPLFETYKIALALYEIITFFSDDDKSNSDPKIIFKLNDEVLYWKGDTLYKESNIVEKRIQICIESRACDFKIDIMFTNFQNFIICLEKTIRDSFCFKFEDIVFLNYILKESLHVIASYSNDFEALKCVKVFNETNAHCCKSVKVDFLQYYLEIFLVLKKIGLLIMDKNPRKEILKALM